MAPFPSPSERTAALALLLLATRDVSKDEIQAHTMNVECSSRRSRSKRLFMSKTGWKGIKIETAWKAPMKRRRVRCLVMDKKDEAILNLLSRGSCLPEVKIRTELGDNPDTSKALRKLLRLGKVTRVGAGGRHQPYAYTVYVFILKLVIYVCIFTHNPLVL
ncbi:hypothetical protein ACFX2I_014228 [Malus domestica]